MSFKRLPPPPPDSTETCNCAQPDPVNMGFITYCGKCGKKLPAGRISPRQNQVPTPALRTQNIPTKTMVKPVIKQPASMTSTQGKITMKASHPLEARFLKNLGVNVENAQPPGVTPPGVSPPPGVTPPGVSPPPGVTPPGVSPPPGVTPPGVSPPPGVPASQQPYTPSTPQLTPSSVITPPSALPDPSSLAPSMASSPQAQDAGETAEGSSDNLKFDLDVVESQIDDATKSEIRFETVMENFKNIITSKNKLLPYEFADELGIADYIEEFYDFINEKDKDGIITIKGDEVKINKTKLLGAIMLGDNSILDRQMTRFRTWLMKILK
ncbi:MAG: hypothetical protein ACTSVI_14610 [Promethearchaeota archaeon]